MWKIKNMINPEPQLEHQYEKRSCNNCCYIGSCIATKNRDETMTWADCAKYGCRQYKGEFINEISKFTNDESKNEYIECLF